VFVFVWGGMVGGEMPDSRAHPGATIRRIAGAGVLPVAFAAA
jgi:hypothetical protein